MILKIQFSAKKSQKNICYTEIYTPVEEFMRFKEELIFTGVNHPSPPPTVSPSPGVKVNFPVSGSVSISDNFVDFSKL